MTFLKATITGNLRKAMDGEVRRVAGSLKRAVTTAGSGAQSELRAQARSAGFKDGGRSIANAWRLNVYPRPGVGPNSFRPAALITNKMAEVVDIFDRGVTITVKRHKYLAIPTPINRTSAKRSNNGQYPVRVTALEMFRSGGFTRKTSNPRVVLWCLPLRTETSKRGRVRVFAGRYTQVLTGNRKGQQAARKEYAAQRTFVPMFFLMKQVTLRKRLDIEQVRRRAPGVFAREAVKELNR